MRVLFGYLYRNMISSRAVQIAIRGPRFTDTSCAQKKMCRDFVG